MNPNRLLVQVSLIAALVIFVGLVTGCVYPEARIETAIVTKTPINPVQPTAVQPTEAVLHEPEPSATPSLAQPTATATTTPNPSPTADGLQVYDAFDDDCINTSLWRELAISNGLTTSSKQADGCWDLAEYGFDERDGRLYLTCSNPSSTDNRTYYLLWQSGRTFSDVELSLTVKAVQTGFGAMGLLFNLGENWSYYTLWYGGGWDIQEGRIVFETEGRSGENKVLPDPSTAYTLPGTVKLRLRWDGTNLHFYVDGQEVMTEPARTYGHTLGIMCDMGWNDNNSDYIITGYIDEVRVKYR
jgi:hypothetical protein